MYKQYKRKIKIEEIWKDIPGFEDIYQASNLGKIRSLDRYVDNQPNGVSKRLVKGRILKTFLAGAGYEYVVLSVKQKKFRTSVHRLVAAAFLGKSTLTVHHKNENKLDNRLENLEYCTQKENCNKGDRNLKISNIQKHIIHERERDENGRFI